MKKASLFTLLIMLFAVVFSVNGQDNIPLNDYSIVNKGMYVSGQVSTNGLGFDLRYIFNKTITIKTGVETLSFSYNFDFDENDIDYDADLDFSTGGIFLLADINYTKNLYVSLGATMNLLNTEVKGYAVSDLQYGDIVVPASQVGDFTINLTPSYKISPYLGAGIRSFLGKKERVIYSFETGFYYVGAPNIEIEATGLLAPTADPAHGQREMLEKQFSQYKLYPVIKFNVAIKLF